MTRRRSSGPPRTGSTRTPRAMTAGTVVSPYPDATSCPAGSPPSEGHTGVHDRTNSHRATSKKGPLLMILIELIFDAPPDAHDNVAELARRTTAATHRENGCIFYRFTADLDHPSRFILTELWESEEHLKAHFAGQAFKNFWVELPPGGNFISSTAWEGPLTAYVPPSPAQ